MEDGLLTSILRQIEGRLDQISHRLDRLVEDVASIRAVQAATEERLRQGAEKFEAHGVRLTSLEALAEQAREYCAVRRDATTRRDWRWRRIGILATAAGVVATWLALLGRAMAWF